MPRLDELIRGALERDSRSLGKLARIIDDGLEEKEEVLRRLHGIETGSRVSGITGPPGAGKSTLISSLIGEIRSRGLTVAVLAVDPTSPYSGGAVLGDRVRMQEHATDPGVFIRSLATRGHAGGLSRSAHNLLALLTAAGFDHVILETVGIGQEEVQIKDMAQTTVFITVPGLGDGIQAMKAGVLEIAHIYLVNKADLPDADSTVRDLTAMMSMGHGEDGWAPPVLKTVAREGVGIADVLDEIDRHHGYLTSSGGIERWRRSLAETSVREAIWEILEGSIHDLVHGDKAFFEEDVGKITSGLDDPVSVARRWLTRLDFSHD